MTLAASSRYKLYQPVVSTTVFQIPFDIFDESDVRVFVDRDELAPVNFTVSGSFSNGRSSDAIVTLNSGVSNVDLEIYGARPAAQSVDLKSTSPDLATSVEEMVDEQAASMQEVQRDVDQAIRVSPTVASGVRLAEAVAGKMLALDPADKTKIIMGPSSVEVFTSEFNAATSASAAAGSAADASASATSALDSASEAFLSETNAAASAASAADLMTRNVVGAAANFAISTNQNGNVFRATAAITVSLPAVASAGDGFWFSIIADGFDCILDPSGAELIDGAATLTILNGQEVDVFCSGSAWFAKSQPVNVHAHSASDITSGTLSIARGGTGGGTAPAARTALGLALGTDVQAYDASLASLSGLSLAAGDLLYATAADTLARLPKGTAGNVLVQGASAPAWEAPVGKVSAWAVINGTGTAAVLDSGNVLSLTDHGTGEFSINFATAMPDTNYAWFGSVVRNLTTSDTSVGTVQGHNNYMPTVSSLRVLVRDANPGATAPVDPIRLSLAIIK